MAAKCNTHPGNIAVILCETCERKICKDCSTHSKHVQIPLKDINKAYNDLQFNYQFINKVHALERKVQERRDLVINEVTKMSARTLTELANIRENEAEISRLVTEIRDGNSLTEEKFLKTKKALSESKSTSSSRLEFIQSHYQMGIIPKLIGRLEYVASNQELVELCSFKTSKESFIKSICTVDSTKAWILHYKGEGIHLVDYNGQILETRNFGEPIEDFCLTAAGNVLYTTWNGSELKKCTNDSGTLSLHKFDQWYITRGLCWKGEDAMVCLCSTRNGKPNRLAKMSLAEQTARELKFNSHTELFEPGKVCCKSSDPIIIAVVDWSDAGRIVKAVDKEGRFLWEWRGEMMDGTKVRPFKPYDILFCNINQEKRFLVSLKGTGWNKICSINANDGGDPRCIYNGDRDSCDGAIDQDPDGHIWIGDQKGSIHIMDTIEIQ